MMRWYDALPGVQGSSPLTGQALTGWPDRAMEDRLARLSFCPVALSELYAIAQHLPMVVLDTPAGLELSIDLRRESTNRPAFDAGGRSTLPYQPVAFRQLPFMVDADGTMLRLDDSLAQPDISRPVELQKRLVSILAAQVEGRRKLRAALNAARDAGLIAPATGTGDATTLDVTALAAGDEIAGCDDPLALRVVTVILFAQKNRRNAAAILTPGIRARLSLVREDTLRDRPFMIDDTPIDFAALPPPADAAGS